MSEPSTEPDLDDLGRRMEGAVTALRHELVALRTGRASASVLEPVVIEAYGSQMPLNQVATINVPEARMITVSVWDKGNVSLVDKAIRNSGLGLNPVVDGTLLRVPIPELTEDRRKELVKFAHQYAESARIAVRNVRRHGMDELKRLERDAHLSQDDHKLYADEVQSMTDKYIGTINEILAAKEKDILTV
ncbi:MAG: ribosome recycling factor [Pseudomonadota bacterium]